jgi:hypothetical protein
MFNSNQAFKPLGGDDFKPLLVQKKVEIIIPQEGFYTLGVQT